MNILENLDTGFQSVSSIKEQLFEVKKIQLQTGIEGFTSPDSFATFKHTGGVALGTVGNSFEPTQPAFLFDNFVESLIEANADLNTLKYTELKGGKRIMFSADIGTFSYTNLQGMNDELISRINVCTGYDGGQKTKLFLSTLRMVCANGMKAWNTEFEVSFKNTKGNVGKANSLWNDVAKAIGSQTQYKEFLELLTKKEVTKKEHNEYIKRVTGLDLKDYQTMSTKSRTIFDKINEAVAIEQKSAGATAWALLNGITRYTNHMVKYNEEDTNDFIFTGVGEKLNYNAQEVASKMFAN